MQLIGREQEQASIQTALDGLAAGHGAMLLLCGEAGIGKSSLARWAAETAEQAAIAPHWGICWEAGGAPAYWPWSQLFRSLLADDANGGELDSLVRASPALLQLLPEYSTEGAAPQDINADQARFQLLEAVRVLLQRVSSSRPLLLLLEDLHTADTDSLLLLQYLAPHLTSLPICILGNFRDADARLTGSAAPLWQAARGATLMHLQGLSEQEIELLLQRMTGSGATAAQLQSLSERTDGNPFFLTELIQLRAGGYEDELPDSVNEAIRQHVGRLPAETRALLEAAAVMGRTFTENDLPALCETGNVDISTTLDPALKLDMIQPTGEGRYRFSHILYRDVIHHLLDPQRRRDLHLRYSAHLRQLIDSGQQQRWQELALHLERAGSGERPACVSAWRRAGDYARQVSAFEDAVYCQQRALALFGDGPSAKPLERCGLLLELADCMLARGEVEAGHDYCREVFRIARALDDASLMARAALTFGSTYVAASIDDELIRLLEEALSGLPDGDMADRAQVIARLAAALQPADDPSVPIDMAREAIGLARNCGDSKVLLPTLRSAISAMMDIAPAEERLGLNKEYIDLADREGNRVEEFRGYTRLTVDYGVLGRGREMDGAITAAVSIADELALPHYQWRAASARAMQAIIRGDHAAAEKLLAQADELARQCEDPNAPLCLAIQRFSLLDITPGADAELAAGILDAVEAVLEYNPVAAVYVRPRILNTKHQFQLPISARDEIGAQYLDKIRNDGDPCTLALLAEWAIGTGDAKLCETLYGDLLPHAKECGHWGLMGMEWSGPLAYTLACCARFLDKPEQFEKHLAQARTLAEAMGAGPVREKIEALAEGGGQAGSSRVAPASMGQSTLILEPDGEMWRVAFGTDSVLMKNSKGLQILARLLDSPDQEIHVLDLVGASAVDGQEEVGGDAALDDQARQAYKQRLRELEEELQEAEEFDDIGRSEQAREEMEFIARELSRAFGLGGRARKSGTDAERARVNVQRRLKDAVRRIGDQLPDAGRYLEGTIDTGTYCRYRPL